MKPILEAKGLWKNYPTPNGQDVSAIRNVSFSIKAGEKVFITGHSGAGKTTLFNLISLFELPTNGEILVNGKDICHLNKIKAASYRQQIAVVPQIPILLRDRTVLDNILLSLYISGKTVEDATKAAEGALSHVQLTEYMYHNPLILSAGEQQRVAIARGLARRPKILLADEPTGNLDVELSEKIMKLFIDMNEQIGTTLLIATHELGLVERFKKSHQFSHYLLHEGAMKPVKQ